MEAPKVDLPGVDLPEIDDPELQPPKEKDLRLGLDPDAQDSIDQFARGPEVATAKSEAAGDFDARGLGLGSGATTIEWKQAEPPAKKAEVDPVNPEEGKFVEKIVAPQLNLPAEQPEPSEAVVAPQQVEEAKDDPRIQPEQKLITEPAKETLAPSADDEPAQPTPSVPIELPPTSTEGGQENGRATAICRG